MWGLPALGTFPRFTCPQIIPHKLAFVETCAFVHAVPAPIALKIYQVAYFSTFFLNMQVELVFSCSAKNGVWFKFCSMTFVKFAQLHNSCIPTPQQCTWTFVTY
jgi:hypothetical protein